MTPPCSAVQLATSCFKQTMRRPTLYILPWLIAAVMQLTSALFTKLDMTAAGMLVGVSATASWLFLVCMHYAAQSAFACVAARGLGWRQQLHTLRHRLGAMVSCLLRYQVLLLWYIGKPLAVCWAITGGVAAGCHFNLWRWPDIGIGAFQTLAGVAMVQIVVCLLWGAGLAEARLLLSRALVLEGADGAEAIRASQERSTEARGWLLKAVLLTHMPALCVGIAGAFSELVAPGISESSAAVGAFYVAMTLLVPVPASLPMVALMALTPAPPASEELPLAA